MIRITAVRFSGGASHQHISDLLWVQSTGGDSTSSTRRQIIDWLEENTANQATVGVGADTAYVGVFGEGPGAWLQTYADDQWNNNLLSLPRF